MMNIAIAGAAGRMGRMLIEAVLNAPDAQLTGAMEVSSCSVLGRDAGEFMGRETGVVLTDVTHAPDLALAGSGLLIDFTRPAATVAHLEYCLSRRIGMVIGTTGFDPDQRAQIAAAAEQIPIVCAPNMSVGVNATLKLLELAAKILSADYDIEVIEAHHRHKVDAPSGTALAMGETIARTLGHELSDVALFAREGITGERVNGTIGFSTIRGGDIVGDHTVLFCGTGERVEITHRSSSRMNYALGSLRACRFLMGRKSGLFDMQDVLGLR
jgi:4-hydroxy-tetrahydrodipicolinate reductase